MRTALAKLCVGEQHGVAQAHLDAALASVAVVEGIYRALQQDLFRIADVENARKEVLAVQALLPAPQQQ